MLYEAVPGFFAQDDLLANAASIGAVPLRFGLLDSSPDRWSKFQKRITELNEEGKGEVRYKVIFLGRHGEGFHNVAEAKYGTEAWDDYWSKLNGDEEMTWGPDPDLTELGKSQAKEAQSMWKEERRSGLPLPAVLYSSPLTRAMRTSIITFNGVLPDDHLTEIVVIENCREECGEHTCDKRRSRAYIRSAFPTFKFEDGFTEEDEIWAPDVRETKEHVIIRARQVLDMIFAKNSGNFISVTAHGGIINALLVAMGRPRYPLPTGGVLPVVCRSKPNEDT